MTSAGDLAQGGFFGELIGAVDRAFPASPPLAVQPCAHEELQAWRDAHRAAIEQALADQRRLLQARQAALARWNAGDRAAFQWAFGSTDEAARQAITARIDRMLALNAAMTADNFRPADPSKPGVFAYVYRNDEGHTVYLDQEFERARELGQDSRIGVLSHEMSHFQDIGDTHDSFPDYRNGYNLYGIDASRELARERPDLALQHADTFEYYVEGAP
jgi:hypothetical protein